jgi:hypothetical protein
MRIDVLLGYYQVIEKPVDARISVHEVAKNVTMHVEVTGLGAWRFRLWVASKLIRLAAFVAGVGIEYKGFKEGE